MLTARHDSRTKTCASGTNEATPWLMKPQRWPDMLQI
jgi:hypothetical protein